MMQGLLAERFQLVVHHETKVFPVYELRVAKNGPKLTSSKDGGEPDSLASGPFAPDPEGFPVIPEGKANLVSRFDASGSHWTGRRQTVAALARSLEGPMATGRRVVDKTGLTGRYDFHLYYDPMPGRSQIAPSEDAMAPSIEQALQQQLGLKLLDAKVSLDVIVVDHAERVPTAN